MARSSRTPLGSEGRWPQVAAGSVVDLLGGLLALQSVLCVSVSNFVGQTMRRYLERKRPSVFSPSAEIFGTSFSVPPPMPKTVKLFPQIVGEIG